MSDDNVNHPGHYGGDTVYEVIKVLEVWLTPEEFVGFLKGNIIKYTARARKKASLEDHKKALWYAQRLADFESGIRFSIRDSDVFTSTEILP